MRKLINIIKDLLDTEELNKKDLSPKTAKIVGYAWAIVDDYEDGMEYERQTSTLTDDLY